ncbi:MAG TPA: YraN family protein [Candidatus Cloacimonadota bacterium]|nr:YraN family protein [Candidatus Cloacimonadota bacterium]
MKNPKAHQLALTGEKLAVGILKRKGYEILETNFHSRFGEIDIIARSHSHIIFVEVKTRTNLNRDLALEAVTARKQKRITETAFQYLQLHQEYNDFMIQYDIILVFFHEKTNDFSVEHLENAYSFSLL